VIARVHRKQPNSRMCFVCGLKNEFGLKTFFYELENEEIVSTFTPRDHHQSYPGRLHGGAAAGVLDETIGRAIMMRYDADFWGVTLEIATKFRKPIPLDQQLRVVGRIVSEDSRLFEGTGEILLPDGTVAATATGKYIKLPLSKIGEFDAHREEWRITPSPLDPASFEY